MKLKKLLAVALTVVAVSALSFPVFAQGYVAAGPGAGRFGGDEMMMLSNQTDSQMMSYVITTRKGNLIVIDGGVPGDAPHLRDVINKKGGHVKAWFISHPHSDHVGALTQMLEEGLNGITIDAVYYNYTDISFYKKNEAYRADMVQRSANALTKLDPSALRMTHKGQEIDIDDIKVKVLNDPYLFENNAINNSSVAYRFQMGLKRVLFLGDMGPEAGEKLLSDVGAGELKADYVQMAHHGEYGVNKDVYQAIAPSVALWNAPEWLYDDNNGGGVGSGPWGTLETRQWMKDLGVKENFVIKDGDQIIK